MSRHAQIRFVSTTFRAAICPLLLLLSCGGCSTQLEDGYKPQSLNSNSQVRRAYYASPFTDEAAAAHRPPGEDGPQKPSPY